MHYLSLWGRLNPAKVQEIVGVGDPLAIHFNDTLGPGVNV